MLDTVDEFVFLIIIFRLYHSIFKLRDKFEAMETSIREKQLKEYDAKKMEIENEINNAVAKPSCEAIQLNAILENLIKMKEFTQAHDVQIQLTNVVKNDHEKLKLENEKRIPLELEKVSNKHAIELNAFKLKMKSSFDEYKKNAVLSYSGSGGTHLPPDVKAELKDWSLKVYGTDKSSVENK